MQVVRPDGGASPWARHDCDIHFSFVMSGTMVLEGEGQPDRELTAGDAFVIPPGMKVRYAGPSQDLELLEVTLPGRFETRMEA